MADEHQYLGTVGAWSVYVSPVADAKRITFHAADQTCVVSGNVTSSELRDAVTAEDEQAGLGVWSRRAFAGAVD